MTCIRVYITSNISLNRRDEVIFHGLRLGHILNTHGYLVDESSFGQPPICG